jgi:hypothetical protein
MLSQKIKLINRLNSLKGNLNEKEWRHLVANEARAWGYGGVETLHQISGASKNLIRKGMSELETPSMITTRIRRPGAGRKPMIDSCPRILKELLKLVDPETRGDPESPLRWVSKSTRRLAVELTNRGCKVSHTTVAVLLKELGYSMQANKKVSEGKASHPDRDRQFHYINKKAKKFLKSSLPVISVDTKKKELIGNYKNPGKEWGKKRFPIEVLSHDFPNPKFPKAAPFGVYDISENKGWVNVGTSADTAQFAVESIRQWWFSVGRLSYPGARKLLICADSGGSNGYRLRLWKFELKKLATELSLEITVVHFPPGTSKWNKIEHKLFSFITINWRGKPLLSYRTLIKLIASTTTASGLTVQARLDRRKYKKGIKVSKEDFEAIGLKKHKFHGEWNYTILP